MQMYESLQELWLYEASAKRLVLVTGGTFPSLR